MAGPASIPHNSSLPEGMDPESTYVLDIKLFGNPKYVRKEISWYRMTEFLDSTTTTFEGFVKSIVDQCPPGYKEVVIVQYYDDGTKSFPQVKTNEEWISMLDKHAKTKLVHMGILYRDPSELAQPISQWPITPPKKVRENSRRKEQLKGRAKKLKSIVPHDGPAMGTRSKVLEAKSPAFSTRSKRRL